MKDAEKETRIKQKKSFMEWLVEDFRNDLRSWRGCVFGAVAGYVVSYFFQDEFVRAFVGFFDYMGHFCDILFTFEDRGFAITAFKAWISIAIGMAIGGSIEKKLIEKGRIKAWSRKRPDGQGERQE
ncbi:MAG: hypothetical protein ACI4RA_04765 [Kiritimatiellia bacterium]